jgi:hypothetical protein
MFEGIIFESVTLNRKSINIKSKVAIFKNGSVRLNVKALEDARSLCHEANGITVMLSRCKTAIAILPHNKDGVKKPEVLGCQSKSLCKAIGVDKKITLDLVIYNNMLCAKL